MRPSGSALDTARRPTKHYQCKAFVSGRKMKKSFLSSLTANGATCQIRCTHIYIRMHVYEKLVFIQCMKSCCNYLQIKMPDSSGTSRRFSRLISA